MVVGVFDDRDDVGLEIVRVSLGENHYLGQTLESEDLERAKEVVLGEDIEAGMSEHCVTEGELLSNTWSMLKISGIGIVPPSRETNVFKVVLDRS